MYVFVSIYVFVYICIFYVCVFMYLFMWSYTCEFVQMTKRARVKTSLCVCV